MRNCYQELSEWPACRSEYTQGKRAAISYIGFGLNMVYGMTL